MNDARLPILGEARQEGEEPPRRPVALTRNEQLEQFNDETKVTVVAMKKTQKSNRIVFIMDAVLFKMHFLLYVCYQRYALSLF